MDIGNNLQGEGICVIFDIFVIYIVLCWIIFYYFIACSSFIYVLVY